MPTIPGRVPDLRIRVVNDSPARPDRDFVVYWAIASRRLSYNFALERAVDAARELRKPLVVFEPLRAGYRWASDRLHRFVLDGMREHRERLARTAVAYHPYVEPEPGRGSGLLESLAKRACLVVTDEYPSFFLPRMVRVAAGRLDVRLESVDSNGLIPLAATDRAYPTAYAFRRFVQREILTHLDAFPKRDPLRGVSLPERPELPTSITRRWPAASGDLLEGGPVALAKLPIDHDVAPAPFSGGTRAARGALRAFLDSGLAAYAEGRNAPEEEVTSGLSPYLHFGHVSTHEIFRAIVDHEDWRPDAVSDRPDGRRSGWWGLSTGAEAFLDQLVTWRELGFCFAHHRADHDRYSSLPDWARETLAEHERDPRPHLYGLAALEAAETHDELWNAAQTQLVREGRMHNYLRMLWGKKVLEWSRTPKRALQVLVELNNKYAVDGRDPNSYSGIFWCLGRFDRAWGPERPIFGKIRYMSSENTARKMPVKGYVRKYSPAGPGEQAELFDAGA